MKHELSALFEAASNQGDLAFKGEVVYKLPLKVIQTDFKTIHTGVNDMHASLQKDQSFKLDEFKEIVRAILAVQASAGKIQH